MFTRKTAAPNPAMTVDVSAEGVLVKLGAKPVYFDRKRRQMRRELHAEGRTESRAAA